MSWQLGGCFRRKGERQASSWPPSPGCRCGACLWHPGVAELSSTRENSAGSLERTSEWYDAVKGTTVTGFIVLLADRGRTFCRDKLTLCPAQRSVEEAARRCSSHCPPTSAGGESPEQDVLRSVSSLRPASGRFQKRSVLKRGPPGVLGSGVSAAPQPSRAGTLFPRVLWSGCREHPRAGRRVPHIGRWQQLPGC